MFTPKTALMHQSKRIATALALTASLAVGSSAMAQDYITGQQYLSNITPTALPAGAAKLIAVHSQGTAISLTDDMMLICFYAHHD